MMAPGTGAPLSSVTIPRISPVRSCARVIPGTNAASATSAGSSNQAAEFRIATPFLRPEGPVGPGCSRIGDKGPGQGRGRWPIKTVEPCPKDLFGRTYPIQLFDSTLLFPPFAPRGRRGQAPGGDAAAPPS